MGGDVVADRFHASRIVAHALQRQPERRPRDIDDRHVAERRKEQDQVIERQRLLPVDAESDRRRDRGEAGKAVENRPVLQSQIEERRGDRERDHDRVDALGARRQHAGERAESNRDDDRDRSGDPPRPEQADGGQRAHAEHCDHVAGDAGDRHLRQADHAAIAGEEHQRQRDDAEDHRPADHLDEHEVRDDRRQDDHHDAEQQDGGVARHPLREGAAALGAGDLDRRAFGGLQQRHGQRLPNSPCGRTASTITMITKVETVA